MQSPGCEDGLAATPGLRKGVRVRVTRANRLPGYEAGDKGTIFRGPNGLGGERHYLVTMNKDDPPRLVIFAEDEIEPDE
jgi:hypothetical protein